MYNKNPTSEANNTDNIGNKAKLQHRKLKRWAKGTPPKKPGVNSPKVSSSCFWEALEDKTILLSIKENLTFEWSRPDYIYYWILNCFWQCKTCLYQEYWYLCSPFFFEKQRWINSLILDFSSVCGMVVYNVYNTNVFMLL